MGKHTQGPWSFHWEGESKDWAIVVDAHGRVVANVNTQTGPDAISAPATGSMPAGDNARLIVASPDLLTALRAFVDACGGNPPDWLRAEYAAAETAIAKAEGRTDG
jgi:hypothetical protein